MFSLLFGFVAGYSVGSLGLDGWRGTVFLCVAVSYLTLRECKVRVGSWLVLPALIPRQKAAAVEARPTSVIPAHVTPPIVYPRALVEFAERATQADL